MSKKIVLPLLFLFCSLQLTAQNIHDDSVLCKLKYPDYVVTIPHFGYHADTDEAVYERAYKEHKFILHIEEQSLENYFTDLCKDPFFRGEVFAKYPSMTADDIVPFIIKGIYKHSSTPADWLCEKHIQNAGNMLINFIFSTATEYNRACPIGSYSIEIYTAKTVYSLFLTDPAIGNLTQLQKQLTGYMEYRKSPGGDTYYWRTEDSPRQFYEDMAAKKASLPEYVINFQKAWEMILTSFTTEQEKE
jgi:hypothetical protein